MSGERLECAFILDMATRLRIGELIGLRWKDIDLKEGVVRVNQSLNRIKDFKTTGNYQTKLHFGEIKTRSGRRSIPTMECFNVLESSIRRLYSVVILKTTHPQTME